MPQMSVTPQVSPATLRLPLHDASRRHAELSATPCSSVSSTNVMSFESMGKAVVFHTSAPPLHLSTKALGVEAVAPMPILGPDARRCPSLGKCRTEVPAIGGFRKHANNQSEGERRPNHKPHKVTRPDKPPLLIIELTLPSLLGSINDRSLLELVPKESEASRRSAASSQDRRPGHHKHDRQPSHRRDFQDRRPGHHRNFQDRRPGHRRRLF